MMAVFGKGSAGESGVRPRYNASALKPGESGVVDSVGGAGALHRHLLDMGITPGVRITLCRTAPLGDPLEFRLRGYSLTLRRADAAQIGLRGREERKE